jgi:hypothetical protein
VVIDKRGLARGSTAATTALVQYEIDVPLTNLSRKIGTANPVRAWRRSRLAVESLAARFEELQLAGTRRRASLYLSGNVVDRDALWREHEARRAAGLASRYLPRQLLRRQYGIARDAAVLSLGNLVIDPRWAALALLAAAAANGATIFAPAEATDVKPGRTGVCVATATRPAIHCRRLVLPPATRFHAACRTVSTGSPPLGRSPRCRSGDGFGPGSASSGRQPIRISIFVPPPTVG